MDIEVWTVLSHTVAAASDLGTTTYSARERKLTRKRWVGEVDLYIRNFTAQRLNILKIIWLGLANRSPDHPQTADEVGTQPFDHWGVFSWFRSLIGYLTFFLRKAFGDGQWRLQWEFAGAQSDTRLCWRICDRGLFVGLSRVLNTQHQVNP